MKIIDTFDGIEKVLVIGCPGAIKRTLKLYGKTRDDVSGN